MMNVRPKMPGEVLTSEFLRPNNITQTKLAETTGWTRKHVNEICRGKASITPEGALVLARVLRTTPEFWLKLQRDADLWKAMQSELGKGKLQNMQPLVEMGAA